MALGCFYAWKQLKRCWSACGSRDISQFTHMHRVSSFSPASLAALMAWHPLSEKGVAQQLVRRTPPSISVESPMMCQQDSEQLKVTLVCICVACYGW